MTARGRAGFLFALMLAVLAACAPTAAPDPTAALPSPTLFSPAATATIAPSAVAADSSPAATGEAVASPQPSSETNGLPAGWLQAGNAQVSIALPPGWQAVDLSGDDAQAAFDDLKKNDPQLAGIIGGPEAVAGAALWAFGAAEGDFVDNMNIRRTPLNLHPVNNMQQVVDVLLPEYDKMGLKVTSADANLKAGEYPAARITYTLMMNTAEGKEFEIRGRQYLVGTDLDLWILSYSTTPEREGAIAADFERSALSFEPK
jgi:hypothetical protein